MSGSPRVSIPESLRKTIQEIKQAIGKHSDEDIYTVLKDCNMDPNETTQKFLYLETFQEIKRKPRKKVSVNNRRRQTRGDNHYSSYTNSDGGRQFNARQENNGSRRTSKSSTPVPNNESNKAPAVESLVAPPSHGSTSVNNGSSSHESTSRSLTSNGTKSNRNNKFQSRRPEKLRKPISNPGPTPASTPTNPTNPTPVVPKHCRIPAGMSSHVGNNVGPLSSPSDPVLDPSVNPRNHGAIQRETRNQNVKEDAVVASEDDPCSKKATSELKLKLCKLHISGRRSVVFPNHLHVPEDFKSALMFGTLDTFLEQSNDTEASKNASQTPKSSSPISDQPPQSPPHVPVNLSPTQDKTSSGADLNFDQPKQELLPPVRRSQQDSLLTPTSSYVLQGLEPQQGGNGNSLLTTPPPTQPRAIAQSSGAVSPQTYPYIRQPYPNYMYNPYYSQLYMHSPQNVHPVLSHSGFTHQPSAGNNGYMPPTAAAAASGAKYPYVSEHKEKNMRPKEDLFYNLAQGQSMAYPPAQVGHNFPSVYHQTQSMSAPQPLHQSRQQTGDVSSYSQPQLQYGGQIWNPKASNLRDNI